MPLGPYGGITLDGVQFSTDPKDYRPLVWPRRASRHPTVGPRGTPGPLVIQDFGVTQVDDVMELSSTEDRPISDDVMVALHTRYRRTGQQYALTDWLGNAFTVFIFDFKPVPLKTGLERANNTSMTLYSYTMVLWVVSMQQFSGVAYQEPEPEAQP